MRLFATNTRNLNNTDLDTVCAALTWYFTNPDFLSACQGADCHHVFFDINAMLEKSTFLENCSLIERNGVRRSISNAQGFAELGPGIYSMTARTMEHFFHCLVAVKADKTKNIMFLQAYHGAYTLPELMLGYQTTKELVKKNNPNIKMSSYNITTTPCREAVTFVENYGAGKWMDAEGSKP